MLRPGDQLNGVYEIDALLARGGMGEVYRGHSIQTGDQVAIKVIRADLAENEVAIALFRNEASKLHRLHHEAIIRYFVFSVDPQLNRTYLAMEFVEGEPLSEMLRRGPMAVQAVRRLAQRVALGLSAAHKRDIIHRDVSSDNIIVQNGDVDEAKIIDFGIARSTKVGTTFIDVGFAGKLNYVSPEQLGLFGGDVTARSDIYSLGLVLLEALRGEPADMGGTQVEVIEKRKSVPSLDGVDPRLRPVIEKMLQPDPDRRQQSMQSVADDFARLPMDSSAALLRESPRASPPATRQGPPQGFRDEAPRKSPSSGPPERRPLMIAAGGTLALIVLAGGSYLWLSAPPKKTATPPQAVLQLAPERPAPVAPEAPSAEEPAAPAPRPAPAPDAPAATLSSREKALYFIDHYAGGPCFSIVSAAATNFSAKIEVLDVSREAFDQLNTSFQKAIGFEADIQAILVQPPQCAALDFYNAFRPSSKLAPEVLVDTPFVRGGQPVTGSVSGPKDRKIEALLIGDDGFVQNVTGALTSGRLRTFSISSTRSKAVAGQPQLLMFVSSAQPLPSLKLVKPVKAAQAFPAAAAEARDAQDQIGVGLRYFYVTE
jgi:serine/threonine-protein kinase